MIQKLENQGFIEKKDDETNKKIKRLITTEKGKQAYSFLKREADHTDLVALAGLVEEEKETLFHLLQIIGRFSKKGKHEKLLI